MVKGRASKQKNDFIVNVLNVKGELISIWTLRKSAGFRHETVLSNETGKDGMGQ